eukprot:1948820-Pyramimonas_sp.AAC.1
MQKVCRRSCGSKSRNCGQSMRALLSCTLDAFGAQGQISMVSASRSLVVTTLRFPDSGSRNSAAPGSATADKWRPHRARTAAACSACVFP